MLLEQHLEDKQETPDRNTSRASICLFVVLWAPTFVCLNLQVESHSLKSVKTVWEVCGCLVHLQVSLVRGGLFPRGWSTRTLGTLRSLGLTLHVQTNSHTCGGSGTSQAGLSYSVTGK